jgi:hypothetical protein
VGLAQAGVRPSGEVYKAELRTLHLQETGAPPSMVDEARSVLQAWGFQIESKTSHRANFHIRQSSQTGLWHESAVKQRSQRREQFGIPLLRRLVRWQFGQVTIVTAVMTTFVTVAVVLLPRCWCIAQSMYLFQFYSSHFHLPYSCRNS